MPAAAVIPSLIAFPYVVAVKKLVARIVYLCASASRLPL